MLVFLCKNSAFGVSISARNRVNLGKNGRDSAKIIQNRPDISPGLAELGGFLGHIGWLAGGPDQRDWTVDRIQFINTAYE